MPSDPTLDQDQIQDPDDLARKRAERAAAAIAILFLAALRAVRATVDREAVLSAIRLGNVDQITTLWSLQSAEAQVNAAFERIHQVHDDVALATGREIGWNFDRLDQGSVDAITAFRDRLMDQLDRATADGIVEILAAGVTAGIPFEAMADQLVETGGLAPQAAKAVANYRAALERGSGAGMMPNLRDRRFDPTVTAANDDGAAIGDARIDTMVDAFAERQLAARATLIGDTEAMQAANLGRRAAWLQAARNGPFGNIEVRRFWQIVYDERTCPVCLSGVLLNPKGVPLDEPYQTIAGPLTLPTDSHPRCRCSERYDVVTPMKQTGT